MLKKIKKYYIDVVSNIKFNNSFYFTNEIGDVITYNVYKNLNHEQKIMYHKIPTYKTFITINNDVYGEKYNVGMFIGSVVGALFLFSLYMIFNHFYLVLMVAIGIVIFNISSKIDYGKIKLW